MCACPTLRVYVPHLPGLPKGWGGVEGRLAASASSFTPDVCSVGCLPGATCSSHAARLPHVMSALQFSPPPTPPPTPLLCPSPHPTSPHSGLTTLLSPLHLPFTSPPRPTLASSTRARAPPCIGPPRPHPGTRSPCSSRQASPLPLRQREAPHHCISRARSRRRRASPCFFARRRPSTRPTAMV